MPDLIGVASQIQRAEEILTRGFEEMHIRLLLIASVRCIAAYGCETPPTDPKAAAEPREEPTYTTGSRLPSSGSATVQGASRGAWKTSAETPPAAQALWGDDAHRLAHAHLYAPAAFRSVKILAGVRGSSRMVMQKSASASSTAFEITAPGEMAPLSPTPLIPRSLIMDGCASCAVRKGGSCPAFGMA